MTDKKSRAEILTQQIQDLHAVVLDAYTKPSVLKDYKPQNNPAINPSVYLTTFYNCFKLSYLNAIRGLLNTLLIHTLNRLVQAQSHQSIKTTDEIKDLNTIKDTILNELPKIINSKVEFLFNNDIANKPSSDFKTVIDKYIKTVKPLELYNMYSRIYSLYKNIYNTRLLNNLIVISDNHMQLTLENYIHLFHSRYDRFYKAISGTIYSSDVVGNNIKMYIRKMNTNELNIDLADGLYKEFRTLMKHAKELNVQSSSIAATRPSAIIATNPDKISEIVQMVEDLYDSKSVITNKEIIAKFKKIALDKFGIWDQDKTNRYKRFYEKQSTPVLQTLVRRLVGQDLNMPTKKDTLAEILSIWNITPDDSVKTRIEAQSSTAQIPLSQQQPQIPLSQQQAQPQRTLTAELKHRLAKEQSILLGGALDCQGQYYNMLILCRKLTRLEYMKENSPTIFTQLNIEDYKKELQRTIDDIALSASKAGITPMSDTAVKQLQEGGARRSQEFRLRIRKILNKCKSPLYSHFEGDIPNKTTSQIVFLEIFNIDTN